MNKIVNENQATYELFSIIFPPRRAELDRAYTRAVAKTFEGSVHSVDTLTEWYDILSNQLLDVTRDNVETSTLGQGLGPNISGIDCTRCAGMGWYTAKDKVGPLVDRPCEQCLIVFGKRCRSCNGTGEFKQASGRVVECHTCEGAKLFNTLQLPHVRERTGIDTASNPWCTQCKGSGRMLIRALRLVMYKCRECNGCGEIEVRNPVIVRGSITLAAD